MTSVAIPGPARPGRLLGRTNRSSVRVVLEPDEVVVEAHIPEPGRLRDLLERDTRIWVRPIDDPRRSGPWTATLVQAPGGGLVALDPTVPNELVRAAIADRAFDELDRFEVERENVPFGTSRFDFELSDTLGHRVFADVESVTWVEKGVALFPDTPSERSVRQIRSLARAVTLGHASGVAIFIVPRVDAVAVMPARHVDPEYAAALREARDAGVRLLARRCQVTLEELVLGVPLEVRLPPPAAR